MQTSAPLSARLDPPPAAALDAEALRELTLAAGADDAGVVEADRAALAAELAEIRRDVPWVRSLVAFVVRLNREPIRSPARSLANVEFHHAGGRTNAIGSRVVAALEKRGVRALNATMGFPMEMARFPGRIWVVSHKLVAQEAGLGKMGIHRNLIHPRFGNFVLLGTILTDLDPTADTRPLDFDPCLSCKLCVAACPVGAIGADGHFDFASCYTHNYREFMSGFGDLLETVADSGSARAFRGRVTDAEATSWWQSLSFGPNYKAAYCMSVCPAGEEVIAPYREDKRAFLDQVVRPLRDKVEEVYVVPDSDAEEHVLARFPHKPARRVSNALRPSSIEGFLAALPWTFQRGRSEGLAATYHFVFTGDEEVEATVRIAEGEIDVRRGLEGRADLTVRADARAWIAFLRKDRGLVGALLRRRIRLRGSPKLLVAFGRCFPS